MPSARYSRHGTWPCGPGRDRSRSCLSGTEPSPRNAPIRSVAARTSGIEATVRSGATSPFSCSNLPAAISSGSIQGVASFMRVLRGLSDPLATVIVEAVVVAGNRITARRAPCHCRSEATSKASAVAVGRARCEPRRLRLNLLLRGGGHRIDGVRRDRRGRQARQDLLGHQPDAFIRFLVSEEPRAADEDEMRETADLLVDVHDLAVDRVGIAGDEDAALDRLLGVDADQAGAGTAAASRGGPPDT